MNKLADMLFNLLKVSGALFLVAMIVMVFGNVVLRYAFNQGISVSEELSSWCLTWMTYTAGLVALREHGHLGFDGILTKFPAAGQRVLLSIAQVIMIAMMVMFLYGSWQQTTINMENMAPASGISQGFLYGIGVIFSVIAIFVLLNDLYKIASGQLLNTLSSEAAEALAEVEELHEVEHLKH